MLVAEVREDGADREVEEGEAEVASGVVAVEVEAGSKPTAFLSARVAALPQSHTKDGQ